jgi:Ser/Thr protein kinase RdoA (MazF antagonist)
LYCCWRRCCIGLLRPLLALLPLQVIHGDLHFDNVMVLGDAVSGCVC